MVIEGGQIGFDEGGVLQALSKPFYARKIHQMSYDKKDRMTKEWWNEYEISWAHIIAGGVLVLGPAFLLRFNSEVLSNPEVRGAVKDALLPGVDGLGPATGRAGEFILPSAETRKTVIDALRSALDPFNFFK